MVEVGKFKANIFPPLPFPCSFFLKKNNNNHSFLALLKE